ncbi:Ankyrin [Madurella fahalii]|uniref:Ankyrin n=1 Tax=Madurella fahalii TaxID=1157608 RepID=A0ABQ0G0R0_9PEZI
MADASLHKGSTMAKQAGERVHVDTWPAILGQNPFRNTNDGDDDSVPAYTETDRSSLITWLDTLPALSARLQLPLTQCPPAFYPICSPSSAPRGTVQSAAGYDAGYASDPRLSATEKKALYTTQLHIIRCFFAAIAANNTEAVTLFVSRGLVSPDVPDFAGRTPLIAAVEAGSGAMVCTLAGLGARVDGYGAHGGPPPGAAPRTPLMVAAARGNLALVRLLVEDLGADDAAVAPDGQLALRLAADAAHRHVVDYLPARRGGAWRRWKTHHAAAVRRARRAAGKIYWFFKLLLWYAPKFLLWRVPKEVVVLPAAKACRFCWENKHRFGGWCKRQVQELPGRVGRAARAVWKSAKKMPGEAWAAVKGIPGAVERLVGWLGKVVKRIPGAMKTVCACIWESLKRVGKAVSHVFLRVVSVLHTAMAAVLDFFRTITLKDVWNGVCDVFRAVFATLPRAVWEAARDAAKVTFKVILGLFGLSGKLIITILKVLWYLARYAPRQVGKILVEIWASIAKGYHEIMVWFNPKH